MKYNTLTVLVSFLSVGVFAGCYGDDALSVHWSDRAHVDWAVGEACNGASGAFAGTFGPGETKRFCVNEPDTSWGDKRYFFEITNQNTGESFDLDNANCYDRIHDEVWGCGAGGETTTAGWHFR
jgi:hypothetical protein